jgi:hypothetical protein
VGLLEDIIASATDGTKPVSSLLRSMQVIAVRGRVGDLAEWITNERDGYRAEDALPEYRGPFSTRVLAHLTGPFGSNVQNIPIPRIGFPDDADGLFTVEFRGPMVELEELLSADQPSLSSPWSGDVIAYTNTLIQRNKLTLIEDHFVMNAHRAVPRTMVTRAVDAVRNRVLDLALELEQVAPELDKPDGKPQENREQISAVYQTIVHAHNAYVGTNELTQQQVNIQVTPGDVASLTRYLNGIRSLSEQDKRELIAAAEAAKSQGPDAVKKDGRLKAALKRIGGAAGKVAQDGASAAVKLAIEHWLSSAA